MIIIMNDENESFFWCLRKFSGKKILKLSSTLDLTVNIRKLNISKISLSDGSIHVHMTSRLKYTPPDMIMLAQSLLSLVKEDSCQGWNTRVHGASRFAGRMHDFCLP